jgi:hypothetical protein
LETPVTIRSRSDKKSLVDLTSYFPVATSDVKVSVVTGVIQRVNRLIHVPQCREAAFDPKVEVVA